MDISVDAVTHRLLDAARKAGADAADAMAQAARSLDVDMRQGQLEQAERSESIDIGLRVLIGQRQAVVSSSDTSQETLRLMAERAVAMAKEAPDDPSIGLADPSELARDWDIAALELADPAPEPAPDALQADAVEAEAAALTHSGISQVQAASAGYSARHIHLAASNGFSGGYRRTNRWISCVAIAGEADAMERDHDHDSRTFQADLRGASEIGHTAAARALAQQGARKPPTGSYPVLFDERVASSLIGHFLAAANGAAIARGGSWLRDCLGSQVFPDGLDVLDDPTRARGPSTRPFDAEGLPAQPRKIVENGVLQGWVLDLANARKLGMTSTANAVRSVSSPPSPRASNVSLTQSNLSRADLLRDMGTGLLVTSMIGSTINPNTGDYSRGASGFWVENGEITYPVNECTIAGNLRDMLRDVVPANDARPWLSRVVPSCLVPGLTLAGD